MIRDGQTRLPMGLQNPQGKVHKTSTGVYPVKINLKSARIYTDHRSKVFFRDQGRGNMRLKLIRPLKRLSSEGLWLPSPWLYIDLHSAIPRSGQKVKTGK